MNARLAVLLLFIATAVPLFGQTAPDYSTVDGVVRELYDAVTHPPGKSSDWARFRRLMLPGAIMLPQPRDFGGKTRVMSVDALIEWVDSRVKPTFGTKRDQGFFERQIHLIVEQYGDVAQAFSTYEEGPTTPERVLRRGINSIQLVRRDGRWYIASLSWDEDDVAGAVPEKYLGRRSGSDLKLYNFSKCSAPSAPTSSPTDPPIAPAAESSSPSGRSRRISRPTFLGPPVTCGRSVTTASSTSPTAPSDGKS